jgi:hypothetical protein
MKPLTTAKKLWYLFLEHGVFTRTAAVREPSLVPWLIGVLIGATIIFYCAG